MSKLEQAVEAIRKLPSTYAKRHAAAIAEAATFANTDLQAMQNVEAIIGHTTVGSRNFVKWTLIARRAAEMIDQTPGAARRRSAGASMTAGCCSRCAMVGSEMFYTSDGMNTVCENVGACFYRVGILLRHLQTSRNLEHDNRAWISSQAFYLEHLSPIAEEAYG